MAHHHNVEDQGEKDLLEEVLGVKTVEITRYEADYGHQFDELLNSRERELEVKRLQKTRKAIADLQQRIDNDKLSVARLAKLMDRMDELKAEEGQILQRIEHPEEETNIDVEGQGENDRLKDELFVADEGDERPKSRVKPLAPIATRKRKIVHEDEYESVIEGEFEAELDEEEFRDDGDENAFKIRVQRWCEDQLSGASSEDVINHLDSPLTDQALRPLPVLNLLDEGWDPFLIPDFINDRLLPYQVTGVKWLLELFRKKVGGILGDEMGLGKTVQVIAYIASLFSSGEFLHPVLIVCPATLMKQWVRELHAWMPCLRVILLHSSGFLRDSLKKAFDLAQNKGHVLITSYGHLQHPSMGKTILGTHYASVILDEGHKIRNPLAEISILCKQLKATHRIILSGTPIQNNLIELWSLMDFVYPGLLGNLAIFKSEFAQPISAGGYVNASSLQVQTSYRCACLLKDMISPYLLRRIKADVAKELPEKNEQVLFCQLTDYQKALYEHYIQSEDARAILSGEKNILAGIDILRKICNHPALLPFDEEDIYRFDEIEVPPGDSPKSGKMQVLERVLSMWHQQRHRVLLFAQTRQMLNIIEQHTIGWGYRYLRMDGTTPINHRMTMVEEYNRNEDIYVFLLTTKVGGLGINLTGADRVIIYDPDWNPSTDMQARERAWRLGQTRPVTIFRMLTVGTIEEKIYHRQIFKQYLTSRILSDPKQTRFFKSSDLYDLFSLSTPGEGNASETHTILGHDTPLDKMKSDPSAMDGGKNVLDELLQVTGIHSAIEHDNLVEKPKQEILLVEREAKRRAAEAVEAIKQSRESPVTATAEEPRLTGVVSSASILASIRRRQLALGNDSVRNIRVPASQEPLQQIVNDLMDFFTAHRGTCKSDMIADRFKSICGEDAVAFRQVLRTIAQFDRNTGQWRLKKDFPTA